MDSIKVSVVMPVLNGMPYFTKALESVLAQDLKAIEVLVVDAGSTDGTLDYCAEKAAQDKRLRVLSSDKKSMGRQYNIGIEEARGEYVGFCEADDYISPQMFDEQYRYALHHNRPDAVKSDFYMFMGEEDEVVSITYQILKRPRRGSYGRAISLDAMPELISRDVNMWNGIYRRDFIQSKGIRLNETKGAAYQDTDFVQQVLMMADHIYYLDRPGYHYRRDNDNSSMYHPNSDRFAGQEFLYVLDFLTQHPDLRDKYARLAVERLFGYFSSQLGKKLALKPDALHRDELTALREKVTMLLAQLSYGQRTELLCNRRLKAFLANEELYIQEVTYDYQCQMDEVNAFGCFMDGQKAVVIFGAGELGQSCYAFLKRNHYQGEIHFCDNNETLWHTKIFDIEITSVNEAAEEYGEAVFLIPTIQSVFSMYKQLASMGIKREQVVNIPPMGMHSSMELIWEKAGKAV